MTEPDLPVQAEYLLPLAGRWAGEGEGLWVADPPFRYREEVTFTPTGKPFLAYHQRTQALDDGRALHAETGYLRATGTGGVEMLIVQATGFAEIHTGTLAGSLLTLKLAHLGRTPTALGVTDLQRHLTIGADTLTYKVRIAMNGEPLADHLQGHLRRQGDG